MPRESRIASRIARKHHSDIDAPTAAMSDSDESDIDMIDEIPAKKTKTAPAMTVAEEEEEEEEEDDGSGEEDEFQVEKILNHKTHKGQILYRIKWLGYEDPTDETWEPEENLYVGMLLQWKSLQAAD